MKVEDFLLEIAESDECKKIMYKRLSIHMYIGLYYSMKPERGCIDPFIKSGVLKKENLLRKCGIS